MGLNLGIIWLGIYWLLIMESNFSCDSFFGNSRRIRSMVRKNLITCFVDVSNNIVELGQSFTRSKQVLNEVQKLLISVFQVSRQLGKSRGDTLSPCGHILTHRVNGFLPSCLESWTATLAEKLLLPIGRSGFV